MTSTQKKIQNRLKSLSELDPKITVKITGGAKHTIRVDYKNYKMALRMRFQWNAKGAHYTGYLLDSNDNQTHALVSLKNAGEAMEFASAYWVLVRLRAMRN